MEIKTNCQEAESFRDSSVNTKGNVRHYGVVGYK